MDTALNPATRQLKLLRLIEESPDGIPLKTLAKELGVCERTVSRYLAMLVKNGVPILENPGPHCLKLWSLSKNPGKPSAFSFDEAAALYLGCRFLEPMTNTDLWQAAGEALTKIRQQLGSAAVNDLEKMLETFHHTKKGWSDYANQSTMIGKLIIGCEDCTEVKIRYQSNTATKEETYSIQPYGLIHHDGTVYIVGYSCKRKEVRTWKANRIRSAELTETKFKKPKKPELEKYLNRGFGIFVLNDEPVQKVRIGIDESMARYVQEHHWHNTQNFIVQKGGGVIVEFEVVPTHELIAWILKFGKHAEVLQPEPLRQTVKDEIAEVGKRYQ